MSSREPEILKIGDLKVDANNIRDILIMCQQEGYCAGNTRKEAGGETRLTAKKFSQYHLSCEDYWWGSSLFRGHLIVFHERFYTPIWGMSYFCELINEIAGCVNTKQIFDHLKKAIMNADEGSCPAFSTEVRGKNGFEQGDLAYHYFSEYIDLNAPFFSNFIGGQETISYQKDVIYRLKFNCGIII